MGTLHSPVSSLLVLVWLSLAISLSPVAFSLRAPAYQERVLTWSQLGHQVAATVHENDDDTPVFQTAHLQGLLDLTSSEVRDALLEVVSSLMREDDVSGVGVTQQQNVTSLLCLNHTFAVLMGLISRESWALQMLDAMGKPNHGIMEGNVVWLGGYDQCLKIRANTSVVSHPDFSGRYCTLSSMPPPAVPTFPGPVVISVGACVPDTCSSLDITLLLRSVAGFLNVTSPQFNPVAVCFEEARPINAKAIVAIIICSLILFMIVVGTIIDVAYVQRPKWTHDPHHHEEHHHHHHLHQKQHQHDNDINVEENSVTAVNHHPPSANDSEYQPLLSDKTKRKTPGGCGPAQLGMVGQVFVSFSVYTNGSKLLSTKQPPGSLTCVHGIRFLSMSWVVLGHSWGFPLMTAMNLVPYAQYVTSHWSYQAILNATVSVDTFFVLSGLLVTYLTLRELKKRDGKMNWFLFYFHRFWRLTPAYMLCLMVYACLAPYWGEGPYWPAKFADEDFCADNWWSNLLYINNFVNFKESCFGHAWYLANDMQFYILSPLIFLPLFFYPLVGFVVCGVFLLVTAIIPGVLSQQYNLPPGIMQQVEGMNTTISQTDYMEIYYIKPYNRMGAYLVGMLAGYFLFRTNCKLRIHWALNLVLWAIATAIALAVLYGIFEAGNGHPLTVPVSAFYNAVNRQAWGLSVAWVVVACVTGNGGFVNSILSWSAFVPLGRLTYCIYLLHLMVLDLYIFNQRSLFFADDLNLVMLFLAILVVSSMVAFIASLAFEAPMMGLEKIFLRRPPPKSSDTENKQ